MSTFPTDKSLKPKSKSEERKKKDLIVEKITTKEDQTVGKERLK